MREGWLIDGNDYWVWRFHRDDSAWVRDPKVFLTEAERLWTTAAEGETPPPEGSSGAVMEIPSDPGLEEDRPSLGCFR